MNGTIVSVRHIGGGGGAIFRLRMRGRARTITVIAAYDSLVRPPVSGEIWTVAGQVERAPAGTQQIRASQALPVMPTGEQIVDLLSMHPRFGLLAPNVARKIWRKLADDLYVALELYDIVELIRAGVPVDIADSIALEWRRYKRELTVTDWLSAVSLSGAALQRVYRVIPHLTHLNLSNPYHAFPLIAWKEINSRPDSNRTEYASERMLTACESAFYFSGQLCCNSLDEGILFQRVSRRLEDRPAALAGIACAVESARLVELDTSSGRRYVNRGIAIIMESLALVLRIQNVRPTGEVSEGASVAPLLIVETDSVSEKVASETLFSQYPNGRHVVPTLIEWQSGVQQIPLTQLLQRSQGVESKQIIVVHRAHALDLLTLNKLLHLVSEPNSIILAGRRTGRLASREHQPFQAITKCGRFPVIRLAPSGESNLPLSEAGPPDPTAFVAAVNLVRSKLPSEIVRCEDAIEELLAQSRVANDSGSVIIISSSASRIAELNTRLQNEMLDELSLGGREPDHVRVHNDMVASVGAPVTWVTRDLRYSRLPGITATLSDIAMRPTFVLKGACPVSTLATADFPCVGCLQLSKADLSDLEPAFALPLESASLGSWSTVILDCHPDSIGDLNWLMSSSSLAKNKVVFVRSPCAPASDVQDQGRLCSPDPFFISLLTMEANHERQA
ncbi:hypothetical protein AB4Y44_09935 [Paraburkholderia sp. BR10937]|uniref:hypothetical protein n=1 Tax=Paraburkholderia sp. BR10937 TaxID=3236994 RepID=UPI0034D1CF71